MWAIVICLPLLGTSRLWFTIIVLFWIVWDAVIGVVVLPALIVFIVCVGVLVVFVANTIQNVSKITTTWSKLKQFGCL